MQWSIVERQNGAKGFVVLASGNDIATYASAMLRYFVPSLHIEETITRNGVRITVLVIA